MSQSFATFCCLKAEEMAQTFRQRIAQAEAMARADMLRFQPEVSFSTCLISFIHAY